MSEKAKKRLKIILTILGILLFTGYFAFQTFVFDPLEGDFSGRIGMLVPRNVDFFLRKENFQADFEEFPRPRFFSDLENSEGWSRFYPNSRVFQDLDRDLKVTKGLEDLERALTEPPMDMLDVLGDLAGREVVVAGNYKGRSLRTADLALYTRISWKIKFVLGFLQYETIRSSSAPGLEYSEEGEGIVKIRPPGGREVYLWRHRDVLVVSMTKRYVEDAQHFLSVRGDDSFGFSAKYADEIESVAQNLDGEELEVFFRLDPFAKNSFGLGRWPPPQWDLGGRIASQFLKPQAFREALSVLNLEEGIRGRAHLVVNRDLLTDFQKKFFATRPLDRTQDIFQEARSAPKKTFLFGGLAGDPEDLFLALEQSLDVHQRRLVNDSFRQTGKFRDLRGFITHFAPAFLGRFFFMVRRNDFRPLDSDPPNDGSPDPVWAVVFKVRDQALVEELVDYFQKFRSPFGIESIYSFNAEGGYKAVEYWSQLIPATGEIAVLPTGDTFYVSSSPKFLREILSCRYSDRKGLAITDEEGFQEAFETVESGSNLFLYFNPSRYQDVLQGQIPFFAETMFFDTFDFARERLKIQQRIQREKFSQYQGKRLPPAEKRELDRLVEEEIQRVEADARPREIGRIRRELENVGLWLASFPQVFVSLRMDPKWLNLVLLVPKVEWR